MRSPQEIKHLARKLKANGEVDNILANGGSAHVSLEARSVNAVI